MAITVTLLPQPDSPTSDSVLPAAIEKERSETMGIGAAMRQKLDGQPVGAENLAARLAVAAPRRVFVRTSRVAEVMSSHSDRHRRAVLPRVRAAGEDIRPASLW